MITKTKKLYCHNCYCVVECKTQQKKSALSMFLDKREYRCPHCGVLLSY